MAKKKKVRKPTYEKKIVLKDGVKFSDLIKVVVGNKKEEKK